MSATPWHEYTEDAQADGSMCICGIPALTHLAVFPTRDPYSTHIPNGSPLVTVTITPLEETP